MPERHMRTRFGDSAELLFSAAWDVRSLYDMRLQISSDWHSSDRFSASDAWELKTKTQISCRVLEGTAGEHRLQNSSDSAWSDAAEEQRIGSGSPCRRGVVRDLLLTVQPDAQAKLEIFEVSLFLLFFFVFGAPRCFQASDDGQQFLV